MNLNEVFRYLDRVFIGKSTQNDMAFLILRYHIKTYLFKIKKYVASFWTAKTEFIQLLLDF